MKTYSVKKLFFITVSSSINSSLIFGIHIDFWLQDKFLGLNILIFDPRGILLILTGYLPVSALKTEWNIKEIFIVVLTQHPDPS